MKKVVAHSILYAYNNRVRQTTTTGNKMTTQERLEAIQALTKSASQLSERNFSKTNLVMAIAEIQNALEALKIDALNVNDSCVKIASKIL